MNHQQILSSTKFLRRLSLFERYAISNRAFSVTSCSSNGARTHKTTLLNNNTLHKLEGTRFMSSANNIDDFSAKPDSLLKGLEIKTVAAEDDGHPLAVYTVANERDEGDTEQKRKTPVLLLHGRTWSSVPVYHLMGGQQETDGAHDDKDGQSRSLIEALFSTDTIQPYAMDFRGFGATPKDRTGFVEPLRCVKDAISVLNWIQTNEVNEDVDSQVSKPALLGWSHGALIAQIAAQRHPDTMSKLIL